MRQDVAQGRKSIIKRWLSAVWHGLAGCVNSVVDVPKRLLVGRPLRNEELGETLLPKKIALPDVPQDLPMVLADPGLLERVVANLVDNAVRHEPLGE